MKHEELSAIVEDFACRLGEHVDAVQILTSFHADGGGTTRIFRGVGNWYARQGMAYTFVKCNEAEEAAQEIARAMQEKE